MVIGLKPMLFVGDDYYPLGGWRDFKGFFDTVEDAKAAVLKEDLGLCWAHIVYENKIVWSAKCRNNNEDYEFHWEEDTDDN